MSRLGCVHFQSTTPEWRTPRWLFALLNTEFNFTLDPAATPANAQCPRFFTPQNDGLAQDWGTHTVFLNPPYGRAITQWLRKAVEAARAGATVVCLVPARTDTHWWHDYVMQGEIRLLRGRLRFEGARHSAPFPSAVVVFRPGLPRSQAASLGVTIPVAKHVSFTNGRSIPEHARPHHRSAPGSHLGLLSIP